MAYTLPPIQTEPEKETISAWANERGERRTQQYFEEFAQRGREFAAGYLDSYRGHPIREFLANVLLTREGARYRAAKSFLESLEE